MRTSVPPIALSLLFFCAASSVGQSTATDPHAIQAGREAAPRSDAAAQDLNSQQSGSTEDGDDCESIVRRIEIAASPMMPENPRTIYLHGKSYRCRKANALALLNRDFGDYQNASMGSGAAVGLNISDGKITSCEVSGGTGYNPNAFLPVQIIDYSYKGSGASAYATTDSSGETSKCVVETPGMNYPAFGVYTKVYSIGADGARGTLQLTNGPFAAAGKVIAGGNGYTSSPTIGVPVNSKLVQCVQYPTVRGTVSNGRVASITSSPGSACTYMGQTTGVVPVCIGGCTGGVQATNLEPEAPKTIGIAIPLRQGVTIDCEGGTIQADYQTGTADLSQLAVVGDPWGDQGQGITIRNCNLGGFVAAWFAGPTQDVLFEHDRFGAEPKHAVGHITQGDGSALALFAPQMNQNTIISESVFLGNAGVICGGVWSSRTGGKGGLGSLGGTDLSLKTDPSAGGSCSGLSMRDNSMYSGANQNPMYYASTFYPPIGSAVWNEYNVPLDTFVERYLWKSQNSPVENPYAPNGSGRCPISGEEKSRAIDWDFGDLTANPNGDPWFPCYRGVSDMALVALSRYGYASAVSVTNLIDTGGARPVILGSFDNSDFSLIRLTVARAYSDPYLPSGVKEEGVVVSQTASTSNNRFGGISGSGPAAARFDQILSVTTLNDTDMSGTLWSGVMSIHGQPSFGMPTWRSSSQSGADYAHCGISGKPAIIVQAGSGVGASATITKGNNCGGTFMVTAGRSPAAGNIAQIKFATAISNTANLTCSVRANGVDLFLGEGTASTDSTGFTALTRIAIPSGTTVFTYNCTY